MKEYRFEKILKLIRERGFLTIQEIAKELSISEITVRRDLKFLEKQGLIKRVRGGATATSISSENSFFLRLEENKEIQKRNRQKGHISLKRQFCHCHEWGNYYILHGTSLRSKSYH